MSERGLEIRALTAPEDRRFVTQLAEVLVDCVAGGASVSFMEGFSQAEGEEFFHGCFDSAMRGERKLLAAWQDGAIVGTVQVILQMPPNQPHRGDVAKLLVHRSARGQGIAKKLMAAAEASASAAAKTLLVLDTVTGGAAERLYTELGWTKVGVIPDFALLPDGTLTPTTYFWKRISTDEK